jgi:non-canonical purine NTP pyrophosphatase (RdgB/HAM1 family)
MIFAIATNNAKKSSEMKRIMAPYGHTVKSLKDLNIDIEIVEDGQTFGENALIKAKTIGDMTGYVTISDDSGLEVSRLGGLPGVHTARYAGDFATDDENIEKLLRALKNIPKGQRAASFVSTVCLYDPKTKSAQYFTGKCDGEIGFEKLGNDGFGYDPVFMVKNKSFAQMSPQEKDAISHRGIAMRKLENWISSNAEKFKK